MKVKRSINERRLLFIAPNVPLYDRNSGDYRLLALLKILSRSYRITYLAQKRAGPGISGDNKYVSCLRDLGIDAHVQDYSIIHILKTARFQAAILEFYFLAEHYLPRIRLLQPSCPVIIDTVDVHYSRIYSKYQITGDELDLREFEDTKRSEIEIYRRADQVIAISGEDASHLLKDCPQLNVTVIPNIHSPVSSSGITDKNRLIFIGGFDHEPNTDAVLYFCTDILPLIQSKMPGLKLTIAGNNPPQHVKNLESDSIRVTGYIPSTTPYLQESYISISPLRYGAGMKGKVGEAMAHGLPVVTTSIGAQGMGLRHGENAMIADSPEEFAESVIALMKDERLYNTVKINAVDHIRKNFSPKVAEKLLSDVFGELKVKTVKKLPLTEKAYLLFSSALHRLKRIFIRKSDMQVMN